MGRPRSPISHLYRVVTDLDAVTWKALREVSKKEHVSLRRLLRSLVEGYLNNPVHWIRYRDPLLFENAKDPGKYSPAVRECLGWVDHDSQDQVRIIWDRSVNKGPGEREPAGSCGLVLPRNAIVELRRLTAT